MPGRVVLEMATPEPESDAEKDACAEERWDVGCAPPGGLAGTVGESKGEERETDGD